MNARWIQGGLSWWLALGSLALAATGATPDLPATAGAGEARIGFIAVPPPPPPLPVSPVAQFRHWLGMSPAEREAELGTRPRKQREFLSQRLAEYERLNAVDREERLNATDLYWHLQQLLRRAPSERSELLAGVPAALRPVLDQRLALWDTLPPAEQEALVQHERTVRYLSRLRQVQMPPLPGTNVATVPAASELFERQVAQLGHLPPAEFHRLHERWREFFEIPAPRAERALRSMSEVERAEMTSVLERFRKLTPEQRRTCVDSFTRLATLSTDERARFLRSAERWESLAPEERATWRRLVNRLPIFPPLPTEATAPPLPSMPPRRALLSGAGQE